MSSHFSVSHSFVYAHFRLYANSGRVTEKFKRYMMNVVEFCERIKALPVLSEQSMTSKLDKTGTALKKVLESVTPFEAKVKERDKILMLHSSDGTKDLPPGCPSEEDITALQSKVVRSINKLKSAFMALFKEIASKEKEFSVSSKNLVAIEELSKDKQQQQPQQQCQ